VDDASTDESVKEIQAILPDDILFIPLENNLGNCKAFNKALPSVKGKYLIDFATDDVMIFDRIEKQVNQFELLDQEYGIVFSDSVYIDPEGKFLRNHTEYLLEKKMIDYVPQGDVFADVLKRYFISSPGMMIRTEVLIAMNGYDEDLVYEDFDLWVRAARNYKFAYLDDKLTKVRKTSASMSAGWYTKGDKQLFSTYKVCLKSKQMLRTEKEHKALTQRVRYELKQTVSSENRREAKLFYELLGGLTEYSFTDKLLIGANQIHLPLARLRKFYHWLRYS